ncbi:MAG: hypothetical protein GXO64_04965 [Candidatus Micrarchaeota archaeon]|nr:hypothetical protein [Candidatus Micrarchaeota archaeon]
MNAQNALMKKYEILVSEWNTLSLVIAITLGFAMLSLSIGLAYSNSIVTAFGIAVMVALSVFEYQSRKIYIESRDYLEDEIFKTAGMKSPRIKEVITKGTIKRVK